MHAFQDPPVNAMLARLPDGREVGQMPASVAFPSAQAEPGGRSEIAFAWETQLLATPVPEQAAPVGAEAFGVRWRR